MKLLKIHPLRFDDIYVARVKRDQDSMVVDLIEEIDAQSELVCILREMVSLLQHKIVVLSKPESDAVKRIKKAVIKAKIPTKDAVKILRTKFKDRQTKLAKK